MVSLVTEEPKQSLGGWCEVCMYMCEKRASDVGKATAKSSRAAGGQCWPDLLTESLGNSRLREDASESWDSLFSKEENGIHSWE